MPSLTYASYKEFILRTLRREGDTTLSDDLDEYIAQAEAKLTRDLRIFKTATNTTISVDDEDVPLPADFRRVRSVTVEDNAGKALPLVLTSHHRIRELRLGEPTDVMPYYAIQDNAVMLLAGSFDASDPRDMELTYYAKVASYQDTDAQPLRDDLTYTDLYDAAVLSELPLPLMADERLASFAAAYDAKLASANNEAMETAFAWDTPLDSSLPDGVC